MLRAKYLIEQVKVKDKELARELKREFKMLASRRSFGLNFERHIPESVELPGRPARKGDKVRVIPPRGSTLKYDQRLYRVRSIERANGQRIARLDLIGAADPETKIKFARFLKIVDQCAKQSTDLT